MAIPPPPPIGGQPQNEPNSTPPSAPPLPPPISTPSTQLPPPAVAPAPEYQPPLPPPVTPIAAPAAINLAPPTLPEEPGLSKVAVIGLILSITGFLLFTAVIGIFLGIAAVAQIRTTGERGMKMAIAAIAIGIAWVIFYAIAGGSGS